jgi:sporulation protein YlmC with PRC-barrel domain
MRSKEDPVATIENPSDTGGRIIAASKVSGTNVYNAAGEKLGSVYDVLIDKVSGKADYAILSFGGFLGIGDKYHPLPWNQLKYDTYQGGYIVNLDRDRLEGAPAYAAGEMTSWDDTRGRVIDSYYDDRDGGVLP